MGQAQSNNSSSSRSTSNNAIPSTATPSLSYSSEPYSPSLRRSPPSLSSIPGSIPDVSDDSTSNLISTVDRLVLKQSKTKKRLKRPKTADSCDSMDSFSTSASVSTLKPTIRASPTKLQRQLPPLQPAFSSSCSPRTLVGKKFQKQERVGIGAPLEALPRENSSSQSPTKEAAPPAIPEEWLAYRLAPPPVDSWPSIIPRPSVRRIQSLKTKRPKSYILNADDIERNFGYHSTSKSNSQRVSPTPHTPLDHPSQFHSRYKTSPTSPTFQQTNYQDESPPPIRRRARKTSRHSLYEAPSAYFPEVQLSSDFPYSGASDSSFPRSVSSFAPSYIEDTSRLARELSFISLCQARSNSQEAQLERESFEMREEEEPARFQRKGPPPEMGWETYSISAPVTPLSTSQPIHSYFADQQLLGLASENLDQGRNGSMISLVSSDGGSIDSNEEIEVKHVLSQRGANSRFTLATQHPVDVIRVEFNPTAFSGKTYKSQEETPCLSLQDIVLSQKLFIDSQHQPLVTPPTQSVSLPLPIEEVKSATPDSPEALMIPTSRFSFASTTSGLSESPTFIDNLSSGSALKSLNYFAARNSIAKSKYETFDDKNAAFSGFFDQSFDFPQKNAIQKIQSGLSS